MTKLTRVGDIDVPQDMEFEWRSYRVRQVFVVVFGGILLAALLGLLGRSGPLSSATASDGGLVVDYQRFVRFETPTEVEIRMGDSAGGSEISISRELLDDFRIEGYSVEPQDTRLLRDRVVYGFGDGAPASVGLFLQPQRLGLTRTIVEGPGGESVTIRQWVWP